MIRSEQAVEGQGDGRWLFFEVPERIRFGGLDSIDPLTFKVYEPDRVVLGKPMARAPSFRRLFWHAFAWDGRDMFGTGTLERPWLDPTGDPIGGAPEDRVAFEFFTQLGAPYFCFHDRDVAPEGASLAEFRATRSLIDEEVGCEARTGVTLLWGTANLFILPRYQAGAATNPDPRSSPMPPPRLSTRSR